MSPEPSEPTPPDQQAKVAEPVAPEPRPGLLGAAWIRVALIVFVVAAVAAIAVAYTLNRLGTPATSVEVLPQPPRPAPAAKAPPQPAAPAVPPAAPAEKAAVAAATTPPSAPAAKAPPPPPVAPAASAPVLPAPPAARAAPGPAAGSSKPSTSPAPSTATRAAARELPAAASATTKASAATAASRPATATSPAGKYWLQVGAFRDEKRATEVAERLRSAGFTVEESILRRGGGAPGAPTAAPSPSAPVVEERFDVFVSGATLADVKAKLEGKTFSASAVAGGVVVTPSLSRAEAETLAKELAGSGWRVGMRRASDWTEAVAPRKPEPGPAREETLHRVRVGSYPDRAAAEAARRELKAKGYASFVAREP